MSIKRISELDNLNLEVNSLSNLLETDKNDEHRKVFKPIDTADIADGATKFIFEVSEFSNDVADKASSESVPSFYLSKQISYVSLANLLTLEDKVDINYILTGNTFFKGNKYLSNNLSVFGEENFIKNLSVENLSASSSIYVDESAVISALNPSENFIRGLSVENLSASSSIYVDEYAVISALNPSENFIRGLSVENLSASNSIYVTGDITCNYLYGIATSAYWADLAEMYESDCDYEPGTLVKFGGQKEITVADHDVNAIITTSPGLVLNSGKQENKIMKGIALVGRVPVKIVGEIHKFDNITLSKQYPGYATRANLGDVVIGKALETNLVPGYSLIECVVKMVL